jgi:hypothetical protein
MLDDKRGGTNCKETTCIMYQWWTVTWRFSFQNQTLRKVTSNNYLIGIEGSKKTFPDKKINSIQLVSINLNCLRYILFTKTKKIK